MPMITVNMSKVIMASPGISEKMNKMSKNMDIVIAGRHMPIDLLILYMSEFGVILILYIDLLILYIVYNIIYYRLVESVSCGYRLCLIKALLLHSRRGTSWV